MAIKDLAVAYNGSDNADAAVDFALQMCRKYEAALTAIYAVNPVRFEGNVGRWITDDIRETLRKAEAEVTKSIEASFRKRVAAAPPSSNVDLRCRGRPAERRACPPRALPRHPSDGSVLRAGRRGAADPRGRPGAAHGPSPHHRAACL